MKERALQRKTQVTPREGRWCDRSRQGSESVNLLLTVSHDGDCMKPIICTHRRNTYDLSARFLLVAGAMFIPIFFLNLNEASWLMSILTQRLVFGSMHFARRCRSPSLHNKIHASSLVGRECDASITNVDQHSNLVCLGLPCPDCHPVHIYGPGSLLLQDLSGLSWPHIGSNVSTSLASLARLQSST